MSDSAAERVRLDLWLWRARVYKTRGASADAVSAGRIRINGERCLKPGRGLKQGDVVTITKRPAPRILRVAAFGERRGPAAEAAGLYDDLGDPTASSGRSDLSPPKPHPGLDADDR